MAATASIVKSMAFQISKQKIRPAFLALATICVSLLLVSAAFAGFEWTPPPAPMRGAAPPAQTQNTPAAVPVTDVEGSMLPMPAEAPSAIPAPVPVPVKTNALPPPLMPAQAAPMPQPEQTAPAAPVMRTISVQQPAQKPQMQPAPLAKTPPPAAPVQQAMPKPLPEPHIQDTPVPVTADGQPYVAQENVKKRMRYSEWLTEAQAQEMSMKVNRQDDPLETQKAPLVVEESTHLIMQEGAPEKALDVAREQGALQQQAAPSVPPPIVATELQPPAPQDHSDVMPLLTPGDLTILPYPRQEQTAPPAPKVILPEDTPIQAKSAPVQPPTKAKPPSLPKTKKPEVKTEKVLKKVPDVAPAQKAEDFVGFGTDIPLAFAMEQILPEDYSFDFADGVNPEQRVSWQGGKPWKDVISEILTPMGLTLRIEGKAVFITPKS
ncbi:MAG: hypothetical protein ACT4OY_03890 [Alphaproteobacteria bacterium]